MKIDENFMMNFRWITPMLLTIILFVLGHILNRIDKMNDKIVEVQNFNVKYTDTMVQLILKFDEKKK